MDSSRWLSPRGKGIVYGLLGGSLWGVGGVAGEYLLVERGVSAAWLTATRLLLGGFLLLAAEALRKRRLLFSVWQEPGLCQSLFLFGILGMWATQYCYFAAIKASNAPTATILQFLNPILILGWYWLSERRWPRGRELLCILGALVGTLCLVTRGNFGTLAVSGAALFWGLLSAGAAAVYTIQPRHMITHHGTPLIVGWGMMVGGLCFLPLARPWGEAVPGDIAFWGAYTFVIIFGTVLSFSLYLMSTTYIAPAETSLLGAVEPVVSVLFSLWLFSFLLNGWELFGMALILVTVIVVTRG